MAGVFVQTARFGDIATADGIADDLRSGVVDRFRSLPMSRSAMLTVRVLADAARNVQHERSSSPSQASPRSCTLPPQS